MNEQPQLATRAALLAPRKIRYGTMPLPVAGVEVRFQSLSDAGFSEFQLGGMKRDDSGSMVDDPDTIPTTRARLIQQCLVDDAGALLFSPADVTLIASNFDSADSAALYVRLREHCGLDRRTSARQEDAKKN